MPSNAGILKLPRVSRRSVALGGAAALAPLAFPRPRRSGLALAQDEAPDGALLPANRILTYYGFPENENMGILGEYEPERLLELLYEQAAEYEAADPSRPVKVGFELIASVAQASPQEDESYVADTDKKWLDAYTEFTRDNDILLFLDVQMGKREPKEDYEGLEPWLAEPHVHLAIDPEFAMAEDELPGVHFGQVTGPEITEAQEWLVDLAKKNGVPPKVLVVHQFRLDMIEEKEKVAPIEGVQLVIDMDGFGTPKEKAETWEVVITQQPIEFNGMKLFYQNDTPLLTAEEVVAYEPSPDLLIYQ